MAKPIFLVKLPKDATGKQREDISEILECRLPDWHVLVAVTRQDEIDFEAFRESTATDITIEALKTELRDQWPKAST